MLAAIRDAKVSITFETYIYWSGEIGRQFADALTDRERRGVKVHVLQDWVGSAKIDDKMLALGGAVHQRAGQTPPSGTGSGCVGALRHTCNRRINTEFS